MICFYVILLRYVHGWDIILVITTKYIPIIWLCLFYFTAPPPLHYAPDRHSQIHMNGYFCIYMSLEGVRMLFTCTTLNSARRARGLVLIF